MKKIVSRIGLLCIILFWGFTYWNLRIVRSVEQEKYNTEITSGYDQNNNVANYISPIRMETEENEAIKVSNNNGLFYAEFKNTVFGTLKIRFSQPLKTTQTLNIVVGERSGGDHVWTKADTNSNFAGIGVYSYKQTIVVQPGDTDVVLKIPKRPLPDITKYDVNYPYGGVVPFGYCQVEGYEEGELKAENFVQIGLHALFNDNNSYFVSSNDDLNRIYTFCKDSVKYTTYAGVYVDGFRELGPYEGDAYINQLSHFSVDNNYEVARETLNYFANVHTWPTEYIQETILLAYDYYMYSGDIELLKKVYPHLEKCLLKKIKNDKGLLDNDLVNSSLVKELNPRFGFIRDIIDWPTEDRAGFETQENKWSISKLSDIAKGLLNWYRSVIASIDGDEYARVYFKELADDYFYVDTKVTHVNSVVNALYYGDLRAMAKLAEAVGKKEDSAGYQEEADRFRELYQSVFVDPASGLIKDSPDGNNISLQGNMFALRFGLVSESNKEAVIGFLKEKGMSCGIYGSQFLMEALCLSGEPECVIDLITNNTSKGWKHMMDVTGSKLTTEGWNEEDMHKMDWNHAWGTSPTNIITRYIIGIRPETAGCTSVVFEPQTGTLENIKAKVPLSNGCVEVQLLRNDNSVSITAKLPCDTKFIVPKGVSHIMIDGKVYEEKEIWITEGMHEISYTV